MSNYFDLLLQIQLTRVTTDTDERFELWGSLVCTRHCMDRVMKQGSHSLSTVPSDRIPINPLIETAINLGVSGPQHIVPVCLIVY